MGIAGGFELYLYVRDPNDWLDIFGLKPCSERVKQLSLKTIIMLATWGMNTVLQIVAMEQRVKE
jgi:hypothetical protein